MTIHMIIYIWIDEHTNNILICPSQGRDGNIVWSLSCIYYVLEDTINTIYIVDSGIYPINIT